MQIRDNMIAKRTELLIEKMSTSSFTGREEESFVRKTLTIAQNGKLGGGKCLENFLKENLPITTEGEMRVVQNRTRKECIPTREKEAGNSGQMALAFESSFSNQPAARVKKPDERPEVTNCRLRSPFFYLALTDLRTNRMERNCPRLFPGWKS